MQHKPPSHLSVEAKAFWRLCVEEWLFDEPVSLKVLESACEALDTKRTLQDVIRREGYCFKDRWGQVRVHPAVDAARKADQAMRNALAKLGVNLEPVHDDVGRPGGK